MRPGLTPDETGQLVLAKSTDDGETWSPPINLTAQVKDPAWRLCFNGPGNGIQLQAAGIEVLYELPKEIWENDINGALNFFEMMPTEGADSLVDDTNYHQFVAPAK